MRGSSKFKEDNALLLIAHRNYVPFTRAEQEKHEKKYDNRGSVMEICRSVCVRALGMDVHHEGLGRDGGVGWLYGHRTV